MLPGICPETGEFPIFSWFCHRSTGLSNVTASHTMGSKEILTAHCLAITILLAGAGIMQTGRSETCRNSPNRWALSLPQAL